MYNNVMNGMKKSALIVFASILLFPLVVQAAALPDGYNGVKWKTTFSDFLNKVDAFPLSSYFSPNQKILSVTVIASNNDKRENIYYRFYKDLLMQVNVTFKKGSMISDEESMKIINETEKLFGKPMGFRMPCIDEKGSFLRTTWMDEITQINYDEYRFRKGTIKSNLLSYTSNELMKEYLTDVRVKVIGKGN